MGVGLLKRRLLLAVSTIFIVVTVIAVTLTYPPRTYPLENRGLYEVALAASLLLAAAFIAELLDIAVAIVELITGVFASLIGLSPEGILSVLSMIGGVLLMFIVGSEIEIDVLIKNFRTSLIVGLSSFLAPALASFIILFRMGLGFRASWLVAIALSTTSMAVVHAILMSKGLLNKEIGQVILASAMVTDASSIIAMALVMVKATYLIVLYVIMFFTVPMIFRKALHHLPSRPASQLGIRMIISTLLVLTLFSEIAGIHAALIAFILGISASDIIRKRGFLDEKLKGLVFGFFSPIFFFTAGLYVRLMGVSSALILTILFLAISFIPKVISTGYFIYKRMGVKDLSVSIMFGARLTVSTIAALMGLSAGLLLQNHYNAIILSAVISTIIAGIYSGRIIAIEEEEEEI